MTRFLSYTAVTTLILLGMLGTTRQLTPAEIHYDGGFVISRAPPSVEPSRPAPRVDYDWSQLVYLVISSSPAPSRSSAEETTYRSYYAGGENQPGARSAESPYGVPARAFPWNRAGFRGHEEDQATVGDSGLGVPRKYYLRTSLVTRWLPGRRDTAVLAAHLPDSSPLWIEGALTGARGEVRYFESPPLPRDRKHFYTVRAVWYEDGRWVHQSLEVPVRAGEMRCFYLERSDSPEK